MNLHEILADAGLSPAESTVYQALLAIGQVKSGAIIDHTNIPSSVVFLALHGLQNKGLVTTVQIGKQNRYAAVSPVAVELFRQRTERFEQALPTLLAQRLTIASEVTALYEDIAGLQALFATLIEDAKPGEIIRYFDAEGHGQEERASLIYLNFQARVKEKQLDLRGIQRIDSKTKEMYKKLVNLKYTRDAIPPDLTIFRDQIVLVSWGRIPKGIRIQSPELAEQYRKLWDETWNKLKE